MENIKSYYSSIGLCKNILDMIFKCYPEGIACKDSNLKYVSVNKNYCKIFSVTDDREFISESKNKFLSEQNCKLINDADNEIRAKHYPLNYVLVINQKIISVTSSPIMDGSDFKGIISCVRDITQEEIIKEEFVNKHFEYMDSEKQLQAQRETFVASVGHDLKNPTIAQIRSLEAILKGCFGKLSNEQSKLLSMVLNSCKYMNGMLSSLLVTYRNYGGVIKLNFEEFSMPELVNECVSEMLYVAREKDLNVITKLNGINNVSADRVQIKRVIMNLITNAIKYAYKGTDLVVSLNSGFSNVFFEFENKSPYIPEERRKEIFARYVSYACTQKELGIGLGLYASKKIIESHNGEIYVKSFEDDRNIFGFKIPIKQKAGIIKKVSL